MQLEAGDIVSRRKGIFTHKGIYLGGGRVFHSLPGRGAHISSCAEFADGRVITIRNLDEEARLRVLENVYDEMLAARDYHPVLNNCQHVVNRVRRGFSYSEEMLASVLVVAAMGAWAFARLR